MRYVLDTNILISLLRKDQQVIDRFIQVGADNILISAVVYYELRVGIEKSPNVALREKKQDALDLLLADLEIIDFGLTEASYAAKIRANLESKGEPIGANDLLIAASAMAADAVLVTKNMKEFSRVPGLVCQAW